VLTDFGLSELNFSPG
jgi:serine/threonine protein kinase